MRIAKITRISRPLQVPELLPQMLLGGKGGGSWLPQRFEEIESVSIDCGLYDFTKAELGFDRSPIEETNKERCN
jgi:hypothetical protein